MPETGNRDTEWNSPDPQSTSKQRLEGQSSFGDSSWPLFSIYSKAAEEEEDKIVERWQKDANGFLIFTGLFSAVVAAFLVVAINDLNPSSQDLSAFYLGGIYQVLSNPNATPPGSDNPIPLGPFSFSPPTYAIVENSLLFLSLLMSLSCALLETSLQQWARRYFPRPARYSPEKRARIRAFFANGLEKTQVPRIVEGLPALLHISLFLFFGGLAVFLSNINFIVSYCVVWWIIPFSAAYGFITLRPIFRHDSPYNSPLSTPAWFLHASVCYATFNILATITNICFGASRASMRCIELKDRHREWMLGGVENAAEETALERSSEFDLWILDWTIGALGDDDSLKGFFEAIPGFFKSDQVKDVDFTKEPKLVQKFGDTLNGFLGRTWSSNSVNDSEKLRRLEISMNAMNLIHPEGVSLILRNILFKHWDEVPLTVEMGHTLARWCTGSDQSFAQDARLIVTRILLSVRERDDSWVTLAARISGLQEHNLPYNITDCIDTVLLSILIQVIRPAIHTGGSDLIVLGTLPKLDIHNSNTPPRLQHDLCALWNEIIQEAGDQGPYTVPARIFRWIRHLHITLHQGTDDSPIPFSASTHRSDDILFEPSSYQLCNFAIHRRADSISQIRVPKPRSDPLPTLPANTADALSPSSNSGGNTASRQADEIEMISYGLDMTPPTDPVHASPRPAAPQTISSTAPLSHPLERSEQVPDIAVPSSKPGTGRKLSTASTHAPISTLAPIPESLPNTPPESYDAGGGSVSDSSLSPPTFIGSSTPRAAAPPTNNTTFPGLRARGLVNTGNICFANAVLQLLVNSPPPRNLYRELSDLKRQRRADVPETGGSPTPLVDATVRFFQEFIVEEVSPSTQQQSKPATGGTPRADEEKEDDNVVGSFEPTYMYDAMKEKRQLKPLLDNQQQDAEEFLSLYLDALDEELIALLAPIDSRQSVSTALEVEERKVSVTQSGQTESEVISQEFMANSVQSPATRIFGGKPRSLVRAPNQPDLVSTEEWRSLHLDIQPDSIRTVQDALRVSQSQVLIEALPPVLVLHLDRVRYDTAAGCVIKIQKSIQLAPELEIPLDIIVPNAQQSSEAPHYKLYGVLYHHGESASRGHYTVDVLHPNGDGDAGVWLHIDDKAVSPVRHEDVFGECGTKRVANEWCAYLLFYCHTPR